MRNILTCPLVTFMVPLGHSALMAEFGDQALAASISSISSAANAIYNNYATDVADDKAFERTKELQEADRRWQKEFYNYRFGKEMDYNTPKAQMDRYKAAGLNPFLLSRDKGMIGSGNSAPEPVASSSQVFPHRQVVPADFASAISPMSELLAMGSSIKRNNAEAFQKVVDSLPELGKTLGWNNARDYAFKILGMNGVTGSQYERQMEAVIKGMQINNERNSLALQIEQTYGRDKAALINQNLIFEGQSIVAEINKMYSEKRLNEQSVKELITRSAKNLAEKAKLEADTKTVDSLREFVVRSAEMNAMMDQMEQTEMRAEFNQGSESRKWMVSDEGRLEDLSNTISGNNPEANLVNYIVHGKDPQRRRRR